jgi:biopolymer transport protein ExbD
VKASELLTLYVRSDGRLFYANGTEPENYMPLDQNKVIEFAVKRNTEMENRLITILKVDRDVQYATVVSILDKLNLAEGELTDKYSKKKVKRERRFSILPLEPEVKTALDQITT